MKLSHSFGIDPDAPWVRAHNAEAGRVLAAYEVGAPIRVPLLCGESFLQHGFYGDEEGLDYRRYYADPDEMIRVQLEAARRRRELPIYDFLLGRAPESWPVSVDFWPSVVAGWLGCPITPRAGTVLAHRGLGLSREACLAMEMPDPLTGGLLATMGAYWRAMQERCANMTFLGHPVGPVGHGVAVYGVFSVALDVRGVALLSDMYDDPQFVHAFLLKIASWCEILERTWKGLAGQRVGPFSPTDHGIEMLSPAQYERFLVPVIHEMNRRRGAEPSGGLHHCGRGDHLFPVMQRHFRLKRIHALTWPIVDVARVQRELGDDSSIQCCLYDPIVQEGPPERIRLAVRDLMASGVKERGRFALIVGDMLKGTPLEHRIALYESVKEFGAYR